MELMLKCGELLCLQGRLTGTTVVCASGSLWMTRSGDSRDHILHRNEPFDLEGRGKVVLTALSEARVRIERNSPLHLVEQVLGRSCVLAG
ncbi:MAG: hypothetical protein C0616_01240 [Desulfuromonas sp.]|nr:MAG: hypothetical protein C0616_01240 [Desulfuromonas sp.]